MNEIISVTDNSTEQISDINNVDKVDHKKHNKSKTKNKQQSISYKQNILFVSNINIINTHNVRQQLRDIFKPYNIKKLILNRSDNGNLRGYGFVMLYNNNNISIQQCINELHNKVIINNKLLYVTQHTDKIDIIYPLLTYQQRLEVQYDNYALIGTTDQLTANHITDILYRLVTCVDNTQQHYTILDCTSCIGTQTISLAQRFDYVTAIELDNTRYNMLQHNVKLINTKNNITCINDNSINILYNVNQQHQQQQQQYTVICVDPPWQSHNESYTDYKLINIEQMKLDDKTMLDICNYVRQNNICSILCIGLPYNFDIDTLAKRCVVSVNNNDNNNNDNNQQLDERPFPFKITIGKRILFILCLPYTNEYNTTQQRQLLYNNSILDILINELNQYNILYHDEYKPCFFDYEKQRWISLHRWKGNKQVAATKVIM